MIDLAPYVRAAIEAATAGGARAMRHFDDPELVVETKSDSTPVTRADRESEAAVLSTLARAFPSHKIVSEESGLKDGDAAFTWYVDPVDGTRAFTRGLPGWATLVALVHEGRPSVGVVYGPACDTLAVAWRGGGAWVNGRPARVSRTAELSKATVAFGSLDLLSSTRWKERALPLMARCFSARGISDAFAHVLVAQGKLDAMVEPRVNAWDVAPLGILVEEAGGRATDLAGAPRLDGGDWLSSNGALHDELLGALR